MATLEISSSPKTPSITFDSQNGILEIKGRSIPENSIEFYKPVMEALSENLQTVKFTANISLEYFNTSSSKCLLDIFRKLENIHKSGKQGEINWYYDEDDEDMQEAGEDFKAILQLPFNIHQTS